MRLWVMEMRKSGSYPYCFKVSTVAFIHGLADRTIRESIPWCEEQFGRVWQGQRWSHVAYQIYFTEEADAIAFKLRWF